MWTLLRPALVMLGGFTLLLGLIVPLGFTGIAQVLFPQAANGSLVVQDGQVVGSDLIARRLEGAAWFQPRPSGSDAGAAPSNLGPTSAALLDAVRARADGGRAVPADAATASGSGLDPHVSPANAALQAARVAAARGLPLAQLQALVERHTEGRALGLLGEPRVNVLRLNLALGAP
ncbi:potassium-transporting ATPase subunit KdpC [Roseomonas frigidaquae]|uniref:Potassium-transporting ATPase KdpC subunit n=1 Tax=Falsiroseomonas frigidaquae TaxID=487318 RepID=A0ABX1ERN9_9PROT|nr:potassium-transporting ATPase subunit KdpC [Falsiroseomonas frigidaquae]NKE43170.1 potassium-transporting ATPase subunit KdpC [Falsiroseomonas frigidaquae]